MLTQEQPTLQGQAGLAVKGQTHGSSPHDVVCEAQGGPWTPRHSLPGTPRGQESLPEANTASSHKGP